MIYSGSAVTLSLLLGASGAVSAAATLPCWDAIPPRSYTDIISPVVESSGPKPKHVTGFHRAPGPDNSTSPTGSRSLQGDHIITTKEVSRTIRLARPKIPGSSPSTLLANPLRSTMDLLDLQQATSGVMAGGLDIMAPTDEGSQKIATLGYSGDGSGQPSFELWSEKDSGSLVFLDPAQTVQDKRRQHAPTGSSSNHSMSLLVARAVPFGLLPDLNLTDLASGPLSESMQGGDGPTASKPVIVRIKAVGADKLELEGDLCATYYGESSQSDNWVPMRLLTCDESYLSDAPVPPRGTSETQLWQHNPHTHEVKPILIEAATEEAAEAFDSLIFSTATKSGGPTPSNPAPGTIATPNLSPLAEVTGVSNGGTAQTSSAILAEASQTRKNDNDRLATRRARRAAIRGQEPTSPFTEMPIVDPYTLIFSPRMVEEAHSVLPPPPA